MKLVAKYPQQMTMYDHLPSYRVHLCGHRCAYRMSWRRINKAYLNKRTAKTKNGQRLNRQYTRGM